MRALAWRLPGGDNLLCEALGVVLQRELEDHDLETEWLELDWDDYEDYLIPFLKGVACGSDALARDAKMLLDVWKSHRVIEIGIREKRESGL